MPHSLTLTLLKGLCLWDGMIYLFDPRSGQRRRALSNDRATRLTNETDDMIHKCLCDPGNRARKLMAECTALLPPDRAGDHIIAERVRSAPGCCVSDPGASQVESHQGCMTSSGSVPAVEIDHLLSNVWKVRSVDDLVDRPTIDDLANHRPAPRGNGQARVVILAGLTPDVRPSATRLLIGAAGGRFWSACSADARGDLSPPGVVGTTVVARNTGQTPGLAKVRATRNP